jgi:hypothetical protein
MYQHLSKYRVSTSRSFSFCTKDVNYLIHILFSYKDKINLYLMCDFYFQDKQRYQVWFIFMQILRPFHAKEFCIVYIERDIYPLYSLPLYIYIYIFFFWLPSLVGIDLLIVEVSISHTDTPHSVGLL